MEYIYLDWNVLQYMKHSTIITEKSINGPECEKIIKNLLKRYRFPFSEGHLRDLAISSKPENKKNIQEDLNYLKELSNGYVLGIDSNENLVTTNNVDILVFFDKIANEVESRPVFEFNDASFSVDMIKLPQNDLFRPLLESNNGVLDASVMKNFLLGMWNNMDNPDTYKIWRAQVAEIKSKFSATDTIIDQQSDYFKKIIPFLDFLVTDDLQILKNNFIKAMKAFASINDRNFDSFTQGNKIEQAYWLLDYHPNFRDRINKKNRPSNIDRDVKNLFFASQAKYYITEDNATFKKSSFVSEALTLKVKVLKMGEFCHKFY